jgi:hypothetical protein
MYVRGYLQGSENGRVVTIGSYLLTGSLRNRSIDNLETQKKSISMKNSQFFDYLLYAKSDLRRSSNGKLTRSVPWLVPRLDWDRLSQSIPSGVS